MKVFITGIRGFLGSHLAAALGARGHQVRGSSALPGNLPCLRIGEPVDPAVFGDADTVVHCAYERRAGTEALNIAGARLLFAAAAGRRRVFISSHSARADAVSEYGRSKYVIGQFWLAGGGTVVRPGLVIGAGGSFGRSLTAIRGSRLIPLIDGGRDPVAVIAICDFSEAMVNVLEGGNLHEYNLFNAAMPRMREIVETVLRLDGRRAAILPVPFAAAFALVRAAETLHIPVPFNSGSLRTLKLNRHPVHVSNLIDVLSGGTGLEEALRRSVAVVT